MSRYRFQRGDDVMTTIQSRSGSCIVTAEAVLTIINSYFERKRGGKEEIHYTARLKNPGLCPVFGDVVDIVDKGGNIRRAK
jgi:hypothetical protein